MKILDSKKRIREVIEDLGNGKKVGFVPTMGALHEGHLSLIRKCKEANDICVCSIFVNPTQFNNKSDLEKYPRTLENDLKLLEQEHCDIVFIPSVKEMYPEGEISGRYSFGSLESVMEGRHRKGHFQGVATVVHKLLNIVKPHHLYLGQKDYQQYKIIEALIRQQKMNVQIVLCPIRREEDGLAMSSRNVRLRSNERKDATVLYQCLSEAKQEFKTNPIDNIKQQAVKKIAQKPSVRNVEYFEIVDADTLSPIHENAYTGKVVACVAANFGDVRLIDNMFLIS